MVYTSHSLMRTQYETDKDLKNEESFCFYMKEMYGIDSFKLPKSYKADFLFRKKGKDVCVAEFKARNIRIDQYPDIIMSAQKYMTAKALADLAKIPFRFFIKAVDGYYVSKVEEFVFDYGGRTKHTRDSQDIEPVIRIPSKSFTLV